MIYFCVSIPIEFFFQKDTKIVWVRNQYLPPQMLHVNDKFVFRAQK